MRLGSAFDSPGSKSRYVRRLFSTIADRYDLITVLLSYGQDRRWKRRLVSMAPIRGGTRALDLACGTGDITFALQKAGASSVGLDITARMLTIARAKQSASQSPAFIAGDMMTLPFHAATFDVVTTGYGIRNVPVIAQSLAEIARVLRPGGLLLSLDFDRPSNGFVRAGYLAYLTVVGSMLGLVLHGDPDTYRYIPESIRRYPGAEGVCAIAREQGFVACERFRVLGGLMAIHRAVR
jgi:ubiquinone/menaquinone biosynthesis methyltransferase